jgi:hypothetical protein
MRSGIVTAVIPPDSVLDDPVALTAAISDVLGQFREDLQVTPFRSYLHLEEIAALARTADLNPLNLEALAGYMPGWCGEQGGVDENGLYAIVTRNPNGRLHSWQYLLENASVPHRLSRMPAIVSDGADSNFLIAVAALVPTPTWLQSTYLDQQRFPWRHRKNPDFSRLVAELCKRSPHHLGVPVRFRWGYRADKGDFCRW